MTRRSIAVRIVLVVAALATVATSAPRNYLLTATAQRTLTAGPTRISVVANRTAVNHADAGVRMELVLVVADGGGPAKVTLVPDDKAMQPQTVSVAAVQVTEEFDLSELCVPNKDCDAGVTVEVPAGSSISANVIATMTAYGDSAFFFPDDRSFPGDATVTVGFQP
jgi:hypothetical protein